MASARAPIKKANGRKAARVVDSDSEEDRDDDRCTGSKADATRCSFPVSQEGREFNLCRRCLEKKKKQVSTVPEAISGPRHATTHRQLRRPKFHELTANLPRTRRELAANSPRKDEAKRQIAEESEARER